MPGETPPLDGITVFEFGHSVAAPFAGLILADLGARVIKVENPTGGDYARGWGPPFWGEDAACFHGLNRGKEGIAVDLADEGQRAALRQRIIAEGDIVIQNMRAGVLAKYGLDGDSLQKDKPALISCDIGAFGNGPLGNKPGYDPLVQAFAGVMSVTGEGGRPPVRVGVSMMDMGSGMWAVIGILAKLAARDGKAAPGDSAGGTVSTSLYETGIAWMNVHLAGYAASGEVRRPHGSGIAEIVPYEAFATKNGWLMIAAGNDGLFGKLCRAIGRDDLAAEPGYATNSGRVAGRDRLIAELSRTAAGFELDELMAILDAAGVPNAPIQTVDAVMEHPHTKALGIMAPTDGDTLPLPGLPLSFDGTRPRARRRAPTLGEHNS
ncbi:CoA transferase [Fodinicurvata sp. EGI_FJ10296]|uniref:CaiB/BaiF CoA transferase family protein n=1 Tax=Fodinicurvata sp. EGI_FJ10296 TaxID=3231908 RepID=UPI003456A333